MYADPSLIRDHVVKLSFNDREADLIRRAADKAGMSVAEWCRRNAVAGVERRIRDMQAS